MAKTKAEERGGTKKGFRLKGAAGRGHDLCGAVPKEEGEGQGDGKGEFGKKRGAGHVW